MHIIFVEPKDNIKHADIRNVIIAMTDTYCSLDTKCWCVDQAGDSKKIRSALTRTGLFKNCVVFALNGNWASFGLSDKITRWLKDVIYTWED